MDLAQQLTNYLGLKKQAQILLEEKQAVENECSALFSGISAKLLQQEEGSGFEDYPSFKYKIEEGINILNIGGKFYTFQFDIEEHQISYFQELEPIKITIP